VINTCQNEIHSFNKNLISYLSNIELNSLYNLTDYIIRSVIKTSKTYNKCIQSVKLPIPLRYSFTEFVRLKCYTTHSLCFVNVQTFNMFIKLEQMFHYYCKFFNDFQNVNWISFLSAEVQKLILIHILNCHNLHFKIKRRFTVFKLRG